MSRVILDARNDLLWDGVGLSRRDLATIQGSLDRGEAVFVNFPFLWATLGLASIAFLARTSSSWSTSGSEQHDEG